ncbi:MAG TPA: S41 family peptidase, partial [Thermomicrobiales bacterium]|nr:S41 family peptidase [Thermomicrobiales bacterium]
MTIDDTESQREDTLRSISPMHMYVRMTALFLLVLVIGVAGGVVIGRDSASNAADGNVSDVDVVTSVLMNNYYYRPTDNADQQVFASALEQQAINGMLSSLNDDYTRYLPPDDAQVAASELEGEYGGIGVTLQEAGGLVSVARVTPDSPAAAAGIAPGDVIERIDNRPVSSIDGELTGIDLLGPVGSIVELTIVQEVNSAPITISVERQAIVVHQATWEMIPGTTYMRIAVSIFGDRTVLELDEALAAARNNGTTGIVLDLRGNGGGWVKSAQETLGRFLEESVGPAMYEDTTPGRGDEVAIPIINGETSPTDLPMIVLVDGNTASAAEIVAGSLRDYDRALVIGVQTVGKGSVQRIFDFSDGASLRVTVAEWFTPSKGRIQDEGVQPDVLLAATDGSSALDGDPFIAAAVSHLDR